jgi:hypothetical protein
VSAAGPYFYGWCNDADTVEAFVAALAALVIPGASCSISIDGFIPEHIRQDSIPVDQIAKLARAAFAREAGIHAYTYVRAVSGNICDLGLDCLGEEFIRRFLGPGCPLDAEVCDRDDFFRRRREIALGIGTRSAAVEAAIDATHIQADTEDILLRLCAPDEEKRVKTGAYGDVGDWHIAVEMSGTYHAEVSEIARDLALSWVHLHDGERVSRVAGLPLEALAARVDAAPRGARVGIGTTDEHISRHFRVDAEAEKDRDNRPASPDMKRKGPRAIIPGDDLWTREQVLAALATPPATLLEALEAAAFPDDEWRAVEPLALGAIESKAQGAPTVEVDVSTGHHRRFIQHHAPFHVRRLPNGGVLLAAHPYRTLWPLWADALDLLGIRAKASD